MALTKTTVEILDTVAVPAATDGAWTHSTQRFSSATGGFTGMAGQTLEILDTGTGTNAVVGSYTIVTVDSDTSIEISSDPVTGDVDEAGIDFRVKYTSSDIDLTGAYAGSIVALKVTNGATGPTATASVALNLGVDEDNDGSADTWYSWGGKFAIGTGNDGTQSWVVEIPMGAEWLQAVVDDHTDQAVTVEAWLVKVTAL